MVAGYIDACVSDLLSSRMPDECADFLGQHDETRSRRRQRLVDRSDAVKAKDRARDSILAPRQFDTRRDWQSIQQAGPVRFDLRLLAELKKRLAIAECVQWDNRKGGVLRQGNSRTVRPLGVADWRYLAREDTGSMFEVCACLGSRSQRYRRLGRLLGMLYHGCDDVADVLELENLGGGGTEDLVEGILTLPAGLAIQQDSDVRALYSKKKRNKEDLSRLRVAFIDQLPAAGRELDGIHDQALDEARHLNMLDFARVNRLVDHVRQLVPTSGELAARYSAS
jgi:hypothetical protein